ncbi:hypothetical protein PWT90_00990 [Aphanocladium album]|nr:hypothetical protein PWT90_00990 [Aphanocladium album]
MELTCLLSFLAMTLPIAYGAPTEASENLHPKILEAMKRDLGLNAEQATARVQHDIYASEVIEKVRGSISSSFAGGWIDASKIYVGVTDKTAADQVTAAGAVPVIMSASLDKLESAKDALNKHFASRGQGSKPQSSNIASYFIDVATNKLVVEALDDGRDYAKELGSLANLPESNFEIRRVDQLPTTTASVIGGDAFIINGNTRCSIGFAVDGGFVAAGHCGRRGDDVTTQSGDSLGTFAGSSFPGRDMSYVETNNNVNLYGLIDNYQGGTLPVRGSRESAVGASVCRSGSTTGVHCGTIQGKDQTVLFDGVNNVNGLTRTSACCDHGDSGGPYYSGSQGQGVTSGQNGNCNSNGYSWFYPLNPILNEYGVSLVTN